MLKTFTAGVRRWLHHRRVCSYLRALSHLSSPEPRWRQSVAEAARGFQKHGLDSGWSPQTTACVTVSIIMAEYALSLPLAERMLAIKEIRNGPSGLRVEYEWAQTLVRTGKIDPEMSSGFVMQFAFMNGTMAGWLVGGEIDTFTKSLLATLVCDCLTGVGSEVVGQRVRFLFERIGRPESSWPDDWRTKRMPEIA